MFTLFGKLLIAATLAQITPADPTQLTTAVVAPDLSLPQSGKGQIRLRLDYTRATYTEATLNTQLDGELQTVYAPNPATQRITIFYSGGSGQDVYVPFDTTKLANGTHILRLVTFVRPLGTSPRNALYKVQEFPIIVDNGDAPRELRNNLGTVYLAVGETVTIRPRLWSCDGDRVGVEKPTYSYDLPGAAVATISDAGVITAIAPGETNVTSYDADRRAAITHVVVGPHTGVPHFGKDGSILTAYDPAKSLYVASVFGLSPRAMDLDNLLAAAVQESGINALEVQVFKNLKDGSGTDAQAITNNSNLTTTNLTAAAKYKMALIGIGDDICRTPAEMLWTITSPTAAQILLNTMSRLQGTMLVIELVDEGGWGTTPFPTDGRWLIRNPPIPDNAFTTLFSRFGDKRPRVSMPLGAGAGANVIAAWSTPGPNGLLASEIPTLYPNVARYWIGDQGQSLPDYFYAYTQKDQQFAPYSKGKPKLVLGWIAGQTYIKRNMDSDWTPGVDELTMPACGPKAVTMNIVASAIEGAAGSRLYGFDTADMKKSRAAAALGKQVAIYSDPFVACVDQWKAMANAFKFVHIIEPQLFGAPYHAPDLGDGIAVAARDGAQGRVLLALNTREFDEPIRVDLAPYKLTGTVLRYVVDPGGVYGPVTLTGAEDRITLKGGQGLAYVFAP